jgi:two-component system response regulator
MWAQAADILLVEDDVNDAELALAGLRQRNISQNIVHVLDGADALIFISNTNLFGESAGVKMPKVILLDLKLKNISGLDVLRNLKIEDRTKTIPVVVFTASQREIELVESYRLGVNSYVIKPADPKTYMQVVGDMGYYWLKINRSPVH